MMACSRYRTWVWSICWIPFLVATASAQEDIAIDVKTVLASQDKDDIDPRLSDTVKELRSLFRYSSYRLLGEDRLNLALGKTGTVSLPGKRVMKITPSKIRGDRVEMKLVIHKGKKQIFETVIQLLNNGSIIVGGPRHQNGSLLFKISASYP